jgi:hypothetical protein
MAPTLADLCDREEIREVVLRHELGAERARTSCAVTATILPRTGPPFRIGAWYHDELHKRSREWRIAKRRAEKIYEHRESAEPAPLAEP